MKELTIGTKYRQNGKEFEVIDRADNVVIAFSPGYGYEIFKIRIKKQSIFNGKIMPSGEFAPSNSSFGTVNEDEYYPVKYAKLALLSFAKIKSDILIPYEQRKQIV